MGSDDFLEILPLLTKAEVEFTLIGGLAATVHGSARFTRDLDVVYARNSLNLARVVKAVTPLNPYLRGAPPGLPFQFDLETLKAGLNFTLTTDLGPLDLLGEVAGGGTYEDLRSHSVTIRFTGVECLCVDLPTLIRLKRAAGRTRDLEAVAELEALQEEQEKMKD
jgi:hypothetical protein